MSAVLSGFQITIGLVGLGLILWTGLGPHIASIATALNRIADALEQDDEDDEGDAE